MALIDRLIKTIYKYNADELVLASGQKVTLTIGSSRRSVSAEAATRQQIAQAFSCIHSWWQLRHWR